MASPEVYRPDPLGDRRDQLDARHPGWRVVALACSFATGVCFAAAVSAALR